MNSKFQATGITDALKQASKVYMGTDSPSKTYQSPKTKSISPKKAPKAPSLQDELNKGFLEL